MDRRRFLKKAAGTALGLVPASHLAASELDAMIRPGPSGSATPNPGLPEAWGLQLYTLRESMADDVFATLSVPFQLGYRELEFAGYFGADLPSLRRYMDDLGLSAPSAHVSWDELQNNAEQVFESASILGHRQLVVPWLSPEYRNPSGYEGLAWSLSSIGEDARQYGITIAYHNHDFEFERLPGADEPNAVQTGFELLLRTADRDRVKFQLDLFWAVHAGQDPLELFERYPGRFISVHVKDRTADGEMVSVGAGDVDFATILPAAEAAGVEHMFVEHDNPGDPVLSVAASINHLERLRG